MNIREGFSKFDKPNYYSRVDSTHPLELWYGLDEQGRKAIELRANFRPREVKGTDSIEINQYQKKDYKTICFSLKNEEMESLFYKFCVDLIEKTRYVTDKNEGYQAIVNRYFQWKKMFMNYHKDVLSEPQIMGLIGEILFFRDHLCKEIGTADALKSWSGQELTHKDFSFQDTWYEVKTVSKGKDSVRISSLEQLDSENEGYLIVYTLEKMSAAFNGVTLNNLVIDTFNSFSLDSEKEDFMGKVTMQGYTYNTYYDSYVYDMKDFFKFVVTSDFPKLTKNNVPDGVTKASYDLSMTDINKFQVR